MEISSTLFPSPSPSLSPYFTSLKPPSFSDPSHLVFYACPLSTRLKPIIKSHLRTGAASSSLSSQCSPLSVSRTACDPSTCDSSPSELDLLKELSYLKAQVKLKKKQLKVLAKQRKKAEKQKTTKGKCSASSSSSSSSSSSESSGGERKAVNMRLLKKEFSQYREAGDGRQGTSARDAWRGLQSKEDWDVEHRMPVGNEPRGLFSNSKEANKENTLANYGLLQACQEEASADRLCGTFGEGCALARQSCGALGEGCALEAGNARAVSGNIQVCVGGKCKKAGSQELLASLKAKIPGSAQVDAMPCKCMGRCGSAINVKVLKQNTNPQHHSHVSVDDAGLILSHHFSLGPPPSGLPSFSSPLPSLSPSILTAQL